MKTLQEAVEELDELKNVDELAWFLHVNDIKGHRWSPQGCPIARYLQRVTGILDLSTGGSYAMARPIWGDPYVLAPFKEGGPAQTFVVAFDGGAYPELRE